MLTNRRSSFLLRVLARLLAVVLPLGLTTLAFAVPQAAAAGAVSAGIEVSNGFPSWYQDSAGDRVEQCLDPNDPNCVVLAGANYDPTNPTVFPTNFPDEFFYALADSEALSTPGCNGTLPGKASVRVALEGAFVNGAPAVGEQMTFGRIRVKVTSGLCPNTTYQFKHPFGAETFTTNGAGAVPANVGTDDVGCKPAPPQRCDFSLANSSRVFGTAGAGGFLRSTTPPVGYLGDAVTLGPITGGTNGNSFAILTAGGGGLGLATSRFTVSGKQAGPLVATPSPLDFGGQDLGTSSAARRLTLTNVGSITPLSVASMTLTGTDSGDFAVAAGACPSALGRDQSCTVDLTFSPGTAVTTLLGRRSAALSVTYTGGARSPLNVPVTGSATSPGAAPVASLDTTSIDFGAVRVRTMSPQRTVTVTNTGTAPLGVSHVVIGNGGSGSSESQYFVASDTCTSGARFVDPGQSCAVAVRFAPYLTGVHNAQIEITSNSVGTPHIVTLRGVGTGGVAAVSSVIDPKTGYPTWYRDEAGIKVSECIAQDDPNCVVLPDSTYDPARPISFLDPSDPTHLTVAGPVNFPAEFFYNVVTSELVTTPGCAGTAPGKAFVRTAIEGAFTGSPTPGTQISFGRVRISVTSGLCPFTEYAFTDPYGIEHFTTNAVGGVARSAGSENVGCFPVAPATCDYSLALSSRVAGGFLRWDPAVAPAAPAGYLGDALTLHKIVGAPYKIDGVTPANFFRISKPAADGTEAVIGETSQFTVMGKMAGPLEATAGVDESGTLNFGQISVGSTSSAQRLTLTNTGIEPLTVSSLALGGADAADFSVAGDGCSTRTLAVDARCTVDLSFSPTATGARKGTVTFRHSGLNDPMVVKLAGVGGAAGGTAAISFAPRSLTFEPLHAGRTSTLQTVTVSNAGGSGDLQVSDVALTGPEALEFAIVDNRCAALVPPGAGCQVDVAYTPSAAGTASASLQVTDNAPGGVHSIALTGTATSATKSVSASVDDRNGFPNWYQDENGVRLEPCLDPADANCVLLADPGYNPANPLAFPSNFPTEFFYDLTDSTQVVTDGCGGTTPPGTASLRTALEGSFANGAPVAGDQTTFTRIRIVVSSGLCPATPYSFLTPYGAFTFTTNDIGGFARNEATQNVGCGAAPCTFVEALVPGPVAGTTTPADGFLRWDPNVAPAAPDGYLGDRVAAHQIVGGTYIPVTANTPVDYFAIADLAGNEVARTDRFFVSGKIAGPLQSDVHSVDFGRVPAQTTSGARTVIVTNVLRNGLGVPTIAVTGANAADFTVAAGGTCSAATMPLDGTCTVRVTFNPATAGSKSAVLRLTPSAGRDALVTLKGIADPPTAPAITVTPGVLSYGTATRTAPVTRTAVVSNPGNANLVVGTPTLTGTGVADYSITANTCTATPVVPGGTCSISVRFVPTALGSRTGTLNIPHNAVGGSTPVSLTGTGSGSTFSISPNTITFGKVTRNTTKTLSVTVKNTGTTAVTLTSGVVTGEQAAAFTVSGPGCLGVALAAGRSCNVNVSYRPTVVGTVSATLTITGDANSLPATVTAAITASSI